MSSGKRVAVVTGSNKGIGYHIVRGLCREFKGDVILTARNQQLGEKAVSSLKAEGLNPIFHLLDISDTSSINKLREFLKDAYGGLDVLVNNAAIAYKCCPGWVQTDMSSHSGPLTPEQGADNPLYAALLPADCSGPKGKFLSKRKVWEWPGEIGSKEYMN